MVDSVYFQQKIPTVDYFLFCYFKLESFDLFLTWTTLILDGCNITSRILR